MDLEDDTHEVSLLSSQGDDEGDPDPDHGERSHLNNAEDRSKLVKCIPSSVRFHGQPLQEVLLTRAQQALRDSKASTAENGAEACLSLSLSSSMMDTDKLRRVWPLSAVLPGLHQLDLSGNVIQALDGPRLSGLLYLRQLKIARNRLRSLRGVEALAGSLQKLDASGNHIESIADGSLQKCLILEDVNLAGNNLRSPQELESLSSLPYLSTLDTRVNPVSGTASGRLFAIYHLKGLMQLDGVNVVQTERQAAHERYSGLSMEVIQDQLKKKEATAKHSLSKATETADELRRENERLQVALRVKSQLLQNATGSATQARQELFALQEEMESLKIDAMDNNDDNSHHRNNNHMVLLEHDQQREKEEGQGAEAITGFSGRSPSLPPKSPYTPHNRRGGSSRSLLTRRNSDEAASDDRRGPSSLGIGSSPGDSISRKVVEELMVEEGSGGQGVVPSERRSSTKTMDHHHHATSLEEALWSSPQHTHPRPPPQRCMKDEEDDEQARRSIGMDPGSVEYFPRSDRRPQKGVQKKRHQQQQQADDDGEGENYTHVNEDWRGCPAFEASATEWLLHQTEEGPVPTAEELESAQEELRAQRQVLREQIHSKRAHLGRIRACVSVLNQQLQEARREAGDHHHHHHNDYDEGGSPSSPAALPSRAGHRGGVKSGHHQGRQMVLDEKRQAHAKLQRHMHMLESRLRCLRDELSSRTQAFIASGGKDDEDNTATSCYEPPAAGLPYEDALVELSKEVELTQDEVTKVASQLCRLRSEMETLGGYVQGRVSPTYLAPTTTGASAVSSSSFCPSPMQLRGSLSLRDLEEGGGKLRRFAAEVTTDFILRLKQRISAAKLLEEKVQTELDQLERELDQAGRILAQLQRQQLQHELAVARQESRISKKQVKALLRALQQASTSDEIDALARPTAMAAAAHKTSPATTSNAATTTTASTSGSPSQPPSSSSTTTPAGTGTSPQQHVGGNKVHASTSTSPTLTLSDANSSHHATNDAQPARPPPASSSSSSLSSRPPPFDLEATGGSSSHGLSSSAGAANAAAAPLDLSPRSCYQRIRSLELQLDEARDREEMVAETGIAVDRRSRTPLGRLEVSVVRTGGGRLPAGGGGGPYYIVITMDPITSCFGRTGAFGSHPAGSYLFRTSSKKEDRGVSSSSSSKGAAGSGTSSSSSSSSSSSCSSSITWNDKFVVKPVLTRQAVLKLVLMDEAPTRAGKSRDHVVAEAGVPLVSLVDQRPHLLWLPMAPPEQTGAKRKHPSSASANFFYSDSPDTIQGNGSGGGANNPVCNLRVRVRFEFSRVDLLRDRLEQLHSTVQARGYDLGEIGRAVMEEDAVRHAMGNHPSDYPEGPHHHHCHPNSPPRTHALLNHNHHVGNSAASRRTTPSHYHHHQQQHHHCAQEEELHDCGAAASRPPRPSPWGAVPWGAGGVRSAAEGGGGRAAQPPPPPPQPPQPAKATRGGGSRPSGQPSPSPAVVTGQPSPSPAVVTGQSSPFFPEPPAPSSSRPGPSPSAIPPPVAPPTTPYHDQQGGDQQHPDSTGDDDSMHNPHYHHQQPAAKKQKQPPPAAVLSTLYDSIVHLKSIANLQRAALASSSPSFLPRASPVAVSSKDLPPAQTLRRPSVRDCFDHDSPYHPCFFSSTLNVDPPAPPPSCPSSLSHHHDQPLAPPFLFSSARRASATASPSMFSHRVATTGGGDESQGGTPSSRPPPSDSINAEVSFGEESHLSHISAVGEDEQQQQQKEVEEGGQRRYDNPPPNLSIFKSPATRRQEAGGRAQHSKSSTIVAGRLIGIDNHETRWRQEMCKRFSSTV